MINRSDVYKCGVCGNIVEVLHAGGGQLTCCGKPMTVLAANTTDASKEKHVPVIEKTPNGIKVSVGSVPHPMEEKHFIEWVEILVNDRVFRQYLKPGTPPVVVFEGIKADTVTAREYCNLHGLWKA